MDSSAVSFLVRKGPLGLRLRKRENSERAKRETAKGRNRTRNAHFRRFLLIFGSLCKSSDLGVADLRRKPQIFAGDRRKPQIFAETGFSHLLSALNWCAPKNTSISNLTPRFYMSEKFGTFDLSLLFQRQTIYSDLQTMVISKRIDLRFLKSR